jgi:hypothetical protein
MGLMSRRAVKKRGWGLALTVLGAGFVLLFAVGAGVAWQVYQSIGRTPGELLDYVDRRLLGHPKLEWLAGPFLRTLRDTFQAAPEYKHWVTPFEVPLPPPRRGPEKVLSPSPPPLGATVWRVGPAGPIFRIAEAARLARPGDVVEIEAGDYRGDVAVWEQSRLTIRGVGGAARLFAEGRNAEGKAIWVIRRGEFDISNVDFIGARVGDRNGAGIRFEGGQLRIRSCLFWDNENGLLTSNGDHAVNSSLMVENSEFGYSHVRGRGYGHGLYVGTIDSVTVTGSYFHHAAMGHLLKTRAKRSNVLYNRFTDEAGGRAAYEVEFPNGGEVVFVGNTVQQQRETSNSVMVSVGAEGYKWPVNTLAMVGNTLVNDHPHGGTFLRVSPGASRVLTANNLLVGMGAMQVTDPATHFNNQEARWRDLARPMREDYRIASTGSRFAWRQPAEPEALAQLVPDAQYVHPRRVQRLGMPPAVVGADQRPGERGE